MATNLAFRNLAVIATILCAPACDADDAVHDAIDRPDDDDRHLTVRVALVDGRIIEGYRSDEEAVAILVGLDGETVATATWDLPNAALVVDHLGEVEAVPELSRDEHGEPLEARLAKWLYLYVERAEGNTPHVGPHDLTAPADPQAGLDNGRKGWFDSLARVGDELRVRGWTCDSTNYAVTGRVWIEVSYMRPPGWINVIGPYNAGVVREAAVGTACGGHRNHGFDITTSGLASMNLAYNAAWASHQTRVKVQPVDWNSAYGWGGMPGPGEFLSVGGRTDGLRFLPAGWRPDWAF